MSKEVKEESYTYHPALYIAVWIFCSGSVILFNKYILHTMEFPYPIFLTTCHLVFASIATRVLERTTDLLKGLSKVDITFDVYKKAILPIGLFFSMSLVFSNSAYLYLSVPFIQMLKATTPVAVLVVGFALGIEKTDYYILLKVSTIVSGVIIASYGEIEFVLLGVIFQVLGIICEATRLVMVQQLLKDYKMDPMVSLYYFAPVCAVMNGVACMFIEGTSIQWVRLANPVFLLILLLNCSIALALNVAVVFLIGKTSSLIMCLSGIFKDILLVVAWIGPRENLNAHIVADCVSARFHFPEQEQLEDLVGIMNPADNIAECMHPFCIRAREMAAERQQCQQLQLNARRNIQMQYLPRRYVVPIMLANVLEDWGIHVQRNVAVGAVDDLDPDMEFRDFQQPFLEVRYFRQVLLNLALFATYLMVLIDCFFVNCRFKSAMTAFLSAIKLFPQQSHLLRAFLSHTSAESETQIAIDTIESSLGVENGELTPMLDIGCRLGEGSGAALVYPILKAAAYPIFLTTCHLIFASIATRVLERTTDLLKGLSNMDITCDVYKKAILPIGLFFSMSLVFSNSAYLYLSVPFIQMLKVSTIVSGVIIASYGEIEFVLLGVIFQVLGIICEATRLVMVQQLLKDYKMDPMVSLYYFAP
ncbi:UNVERIFIED_CONTAM: hypothetical protein HDU68_010410, partial [Siphonaria sp. JEL0065]